MTNSSRTISIQKKMNLVTLLFAFVSIAMVCIEIRRSAYQFAGVQSKSINSIFLLQAMHPNAKIPGPDSDVNLSATIESTEPVIPDLALPGSTSDGMHKGKGKPTVAVNDATAVGSIQSPHSNNQAQSKTSGRGGHNHSDSLDHLKNVVREKTHGNGKHSKHHRKSSHGAHHKPHQTDNEKSTGPNHDAHHHIESQPQMQQKW